MLRAPAVPLPARVRIAVVALVVVAFGAAVAGLGAEERAAVFAAAPAPYQGAFAPGPDTSVLRVLRVEERVGVARRGELVRVPLFFATGECASPGAVAIAAMRDGPVVVQQADDVRYGPDGGVSRMHLWFEVDLAPWEQKTFLLVRRGGPSARAQPMQVEVRGDTLRVDTESGGVVIGHAGAGAGGLREARLAGGARLASRDGLAPRVVFTGGGKTPAAERVQLPSGAPHLEWGAGPLFVKVSVRWEGSGGAALDQVYQIDRHGRRIRITQTAWPGGAAGTLAERELLAGSIATADRRVTGVPAGLRREFRGVHPYAVSALVGEAREPAIMALPIAFGGGAGKMTLDGGRFALGAAAKLASVGDAPAGTLRAFWTESELIGSDSAAPEALWERYRAGVQPLVAVVDEPGLTPADLSEALRSVVAEMQPIGWRQEAGRWHVLGKAEARDRVLAAAPKAVEADPAYLQRGATNAWKTLTQDGVHHLREDEKSRASGPIDPYQLTYGHSAAAALDALGFAPPTVRTVNRANAAATRAFLGRADEDGFPFVDCFSRAFNMQLGPVLFGLGTAAEAPDLAAFYRDLAGAPSVRGVYGRAQRPYSERIGATADYSDHLYQAICDFWLRAGELLANEDLELHPLAYARYTDCIDVLADRYHTFDGRDTGGAAGDAVRANFWRAQPHTHRWLVWSCAPFMRLLEQSGDNTGLTEAVRYCSALRGRWKNWPDLTFYLLAEMLTREALPRYRAPVLLPRPGDVRAVAQRGGEEVRWTAVPGAMGYRVFRARPEGTAPRWLNSPYGPTPAAVTETRFFDPEGRSTDRYAISAVDTVGRESRWFNDERPRAPPDRSRD